MARRIVQLATIPCILVVWQALSFMDLWSTALFPSPYQIIEKVFSLLGTTSHPSFLLEREIVSTLARLIGGVTIASVLGVAIGLLSGWNKSFRTILSPFLSIFNSIPELALAPIIFSLAGIGNGADLVVVIIAASIPLVIECEVGMRTLPEHFFWSARSLGAGPMALLGKVILPSIVSSLVNGFRQGTAFAWRALLAVEGISAIKFGIGYGVFQAGNFFDSTTIIANITIIILIGLLLEVALKRIERNTVHKWGM